MQEFKKNNNMNILVLAAHPDDETIGVGATIAKFAEQGHNVHVLTFTDGVGARCDGKCFSSIESRRKSAMYAKNALKIKLFDFSMFPDNKMDSVPLLDVCKFIEYNIDYEPDLIFTHHPGCLNIDHTIVYRATVTVFRPQNGKEQNIFSYFVPSSTDYSPLSGFVGNSYSIVSEKDVDKKRSALLSYSQEIKKEPHSRSVDHILRLMKIWGNEVGAEYAEKFQIIRSIF